MRSTSDSEQHMAPERMEVEAIAGSTGRSLARADERSEDAVGACADGVETFHAQGATSSAAQHLRRTQSGDHQLAQPTTTNTANNRQRAGGSGGRAVGGPGWAPRRPGTRGTRRTARGRCAR